MENLLRRFVSVNSVTGNEAQFYALVSDILKDLGFSVRDVYGNLVAERGESPIIFLGHLDTLPPRMGIIGDPFRARVVGKKMYGLGIYHMKAGIVSLLKFAEKYFPMKIVLTTNELTNHEGSWELLNSGIFDNSEFGIVMHGSKFGPRGLSVGRSGKVILKITVINRSTNPVPDAVRIIESLTDDSISFHPNIGFSSMEPIRLETISKSPGVPEKVLIDFKRILVPPETVESAINLAKEKIRNMDLSSAVKITRKRDMVPLPPFEVSINNPFVQMISDSISEKFKNVTYIFKDKPCMDNIANYIIPTISVGPRGGFEGPNEWVDMRSLNHLVDILTDFHVKMKEKGMMEQ